MLQSNITSETRIIDLTVGQLQNLIADSNKSSSQNTTNYPPLLSITKVCELLDISRTCLYDLIDKEEITPYYFSGVRKPLFKVEEILDALIVKEKKS